MLSIARASPLASRSGKRLEHRGPAAEGHNELTGLVVELELHVLAEILERDLLAGTRA
jgi:hypothetical protein